MLRTALPEIITDTLPGPKAQALIDRRAQAVPAAIRCVYPVAIAGARAPCWRTWTATAFWTGSAASAC